MKLEVLISTMNLKNNKENSDLLKKMNIGKDTKSLTINQITKSDIQKFEALEDKNRIILKNEKGLSKSRNLAIKEANGEICILADDDVVYQDDYVDTIIDAYKQNEQFDIICFTVESDNKERAVEKIPTSRVGKIKAMKICSVEITFKLDKIREKQILFDEDFGVGSKYEKGEEAIFLCDCIDKGLKIKFIDKKIADVKQETSTWFQGYDEKFFKDQGAIFYRIMPKMYKLLILKFAIGKYKRYKEKLTIKQVINFMMNGARDYTERTNKV